MRITDLQPGSERYGRHDRGGKRLMSYARKQHLKHFLCSFNLAILYDC